MQRPTTTLLALVLAGVLCGCQTATVAPPVKDKPSGKPDAVNLGTEGTATYAQIADAVGRLKRTATAQEIADVLTAIDAVRVPDQDRGKVDQIEASLLTRLRAKVKSEVSSLHGRALKSATYREGYELTREAGAILALYPLSDDAATIKEAEELSFRQNEVIRRLDLIRRQRYNYWAAGQAEEALKEIRENGKDGRNSAIGYLQVIDPSLLESSVASLYSYAVTEIMDKFKKDEKATVAKSLTNPSVTRRSLEAF